MRIIHTGDWHLGHVLYGYDRSVAERDSLAKLVETSRVKSESADPFAGLVSDRHCQDSCHPDYISSHYHSISCSE